MAFICIICNDNLSRNKSKQNSDAILATFCGHLYHQSCLYRSIAVRRRSQHEQQARVAASTCPTCNRVIEKQKLMQIFPAETEAEDYGTEIERIAKERDALKLEIIRLEEELKGFIEKIKGVEGKAQPVQILPRRRQIVALKSTRKGFKIGSRVMWLKNEPEEGVIKWIGTIDGIVNAGVEFVNPVGDHSFPEINGEQLFACKVDHGRIISIHDIMLCSEFHGSVNNSSLQWEINNNDERQKLEKIRGHYQQLVMSTEIWMENFIPKIETMLSNEIVGDTVSINLQLEKAKVFETELADNKSLIFGVKDVAKILLESLCVPLYEKCEIDHKLEELNDTYESLETAIISHVNQNLMQALHHAQNCEDLINCRMKLLQDFKSKLRNMGKTLIVNENQLAEQISELSTIQASFLSQNEEVSLSELFTAITEFRKYGSDSSKYEMATRDIISGHNQFLEDVDAKSAILNRTQLLYRQFIIYTTQFEEWYDCYMEKVSKVPSSSSAEERLLYLMQEKEEKRKELVKILNSAKELRVSIFDSTVLDDKIESLQYKWKILLERASEHRGRVRKTF